MLLLNLFRQLYLSPTNHIIAKIATVPHTLMRFEDNELCYITKRIDRGAKGEKYPMEDMCQLTERLTEYKYKGSYEQIAKAIDKYSSTPQLDKVNFWEQVIFSWIVGFAHYHHVVKMCIFHENTIIRLT